MKDEEVDIEVGQILVTTGFNLFDPQQIPQYGYGRLDNVYNSRRLRIYAQLHGPNRRNNTM